MDVFVLQVKNFSQDFIGQDAPEHIHPISKAWMRSDQVGHAAALSHFK